ncbi:semaphorin-1A-like [Anneissia japonica]|uniref:semaphorin-1A-like n=1 Tax=Anneissia japonica TaxID=1529436 RepID=UPI0014258DDC|nr:semaphorin-1A-like [Anneissia japonica]
MTVQRLNSFFALYVPLHYPSLMLNVNAMVRRERTMLPELLILLVFILDGLFFKRKQLASKLTYERETQKVEYNRHAVLIPPDMLICGTNAQKPKCIHAEMSNLESGWRRRNATDGLYKCPFAVDQKVTSVFAEGSLYAGTVADFNGRDSTLTRSMGNAVPLITKRHDSLWLNHPQFVGSFVEGREVFFFFREVSVENCEKIYRSRIARVCTDDKGGRTILDSSWTTFLKARLDCSFRGEFPFRFNYLQDVLRTVRGGKVFYYAVFTTGKHEIPASAICRFGIDDIMDNFERGPFLRPTAPWGRIFDEDVPDNRPGDCSVDSTLLSYEDLNFVKSHPSLYKPFLYARSTKLQVEDVGRY